MRSLKNSFCEEKQMLKNKVRNIVIIVVIFIIVLQIVDYFKEVKSVKIEEKESMALTGKVLDRKSVV